MAELKIDYFIIFFIFLSIHENNQMHIKLVFSLCAQRFALSITPEKEHAELRRRNFEDVERFKKKHWFYV
jgi:hypothetical protein